MKKALILAAALMAVTSLTLSAADAPAKKQLTPEQKAVLKEITQKYDKDGDKKLSKEERAAISAEDKEKMEKAGLSGGRKKKN